MSYWNSTRSWTPLATFRGHHRSRDMVNGPERLVKKWQPRIHIGRFTKAKRNCIQSALKALERARRAKNSDDVVDAVIRAEHFIARYRALDAAGFFRGRNYENLVSLEKKLRVLKRVPCVQRELHLVPLEDPA